MFLNRISMRVSLVVTVVAMGALGLGLAVISGRIYRDHAIDNERSALVEQLRVRLHDVRQKFDREAELIAREANARANPRVYINSPQQRKQLLNELLHSH